MHIHFFATFDFITLHLFTYVFLNVFFSSFRPTGLLTLGKRYEGYFAKIIESFQANPNSKYELYNPKEMTSKFPMIDMGPNIWGCYDPAAGIIHADKALKLIWVYKCN